MKLKKLFVMGAIAFVLFFLISSPHEAGTAVHNVLHWLRAGADALVTFVKTLFA